MKMAKGRVQRLPKSLYALCSMLLASCALSLPARNAYAIDVVLNRTNPNFLREAGVNETTNPHREEKCYVCHMVPTELLTKVNPAENEISQRRLMRTDLIDLCNRCHKASIESEHIVGIPAKLNRESLPLDLQGNVTCATTCHDVHTKDPGLSKKMLRHPSDTLCLSCHDV